MPKAISNTSPLLYLWRTHHLDWLPALFQEVWLPTAVVEELQEGRQKGYSVPDPSHHGWLQTVNPRYVPSEWLSRDLGRGELAAMALGLENPGRIVLLDDALARQIALGRRSEHLGHVGSTVGSQVSRADRESGANDRPTAGGRYVGI